MPNHPSSTFLDRFTTTWASPFSPPALTYAKTHSLSYLAAPYTPPSHIAVFSGYKCDMQKFRQANRDADNEERERFEKDVGMTTGSGTGGRDGWWSATRGEKLRLLGKDGEMVEMHLKEQKSAKRAIELHLTPTRTHTFSKHLLQWEKIQASISLLYTLKWMIEKLRELVLDEVRADWDWKEGLKAQMLVKSERDRIGQEGDRAIRGMKLGLVEGGKGEGGEVKVADGGEVKAVEKREDEDEDVSMSSMEE